jgi:hypothetical protein
LEKPQTITNMYAVSEFQCASKIIFAGYVFAGYV